MTEFDRSKLMYHPQYVADLLEGMDVPPFYVEISPVGYCNHRCEFCALDFLGYKSQFLSRDVLFNLVVDLEGMGVHGIMWGGEGEPTLHDNLQELIRGSTIRRALTTNGTRPTPRELNWVKYSVDAGTEECYRRVHRCISGEWERVWKNIGKAVQDEVAPSIAVQILLYDQGLSEVAFLADKCRKTGIRKLVVKPFSQHPHSIHKVKVDAALWIPRHIQEMRDMSDEKLTVYVREETMECGNHPMPYHECHCVPNIWAYIQSDGTAWSCSARLGEPQFRLGNILDTPFSTIWSKRDRNPPIDTRECRRMCRMDPTNRYLEELKRPTVSSVDFP